MTSNREPVTYGGMIRGDGYEARCTVRATRVTHPEGIDSALVDRSIEWVSAPPPRDGVYEITAGGETWRIQSRGGLWMNAP